MKIDRRTVMGSVAKNTDHPFDLLDLGVDTLYEGVGGVAPDIIS